MGVVLREIVIAYPRICKMIVHTYMACKPYVHSMKYDIRADQQSRLVILIIGGTALSQRVVGALSLAWSKVILSWSKFDW